MVRKLALSGLAALAIGSSGCELVAGKYLDYEREMNVAAVEHQNRMREIAYEKSLENGVNQTGPRLNTKVPEAIKDYEDTNGDGKIEFSELAPKAGYTFSRKTDNPVIVLGVVKNHQGSMASYDFYKEGIEVPVISEANQVMDNRQQILLFSLTNRFLQENETGNYRVVAKLNGEPVRDFTFRVTD